MDKEFLYALLNSDSVSGDEIPLQKKVMERMKPVCHEIRTDYTGNVISILNPDAPFKVLLAAHIDEIGLMVTGIQEDGFVRVEKAGGIRPAVYPGHQAVILGTGGRVYGAVVYNGDMKKTDLKASELILDIGASTEEEARRYVREGDTAHLNCGPQEMLNGCLSARAIDDRGGAFIILEALRLAAARGCRIGAYAATTVGEETTMRGAYWAGARIQPDVAIAVDVTYAQDYPGAHPEETGRIRLGGGPVLCRSSLMSRKVNGILEQCARKAGIPLQYEVAPGETCTDGDRIHFTGQGVVTALVSLPLRYMHMPSEVCRLRDVEQCIQLLAEFLCTIDEHTCLDPFA